MKRHQTGEVMLVMMVVMLGIALFSGRHMGMMGGGHAQHTSQSEEQAPMSKKDSTTQVGSESSAEHQH